MERDRDRGREASIRTERGLPAFWLLYLAAVVGEGFGGLKSASVPELRIPFSLRAGEEGLPSKSYIVPRGPPLFLLLLLPPAEIPSFPEPRAFNLRCGGCGGLGDFKRTKIAHPGPKRPFFLYTTLSDLEGMEIYFRSFKRRKEV